MEFTVSIQPDADGYTGRECPTCEKYFKIKFGTGLPGDNDCHCPYCNNVEPHDKFFTPAQVEYAQSIVLNRFSQDMLNELKKVEIKPDRNAIFSIGIKVEGSATPIIRYSERELEERVTCSSCTLQYTIFGAFAFCPDCGLSDVNQAQLDTVARKLNTRPRKTLHWKTPAYILGTSVSMIH